MIRVLLILEPVIFRDDPTGLAAHFTWVECFRRATRAAGGTFALAANADVCDAWTAREPCCPEVSCFALNAFSVLAAFDFERARYAKAAFEDVQKANPLIDDLTEVRESFRPDLVVMTAENSFVRHAFRGTRMLFVEQSSLPRTGHPLRTALDPSGHQRSTVLETHADTIRRLPMREQTRVQVERLLRAVRRNVDAADLRSGAALEALKAVRGDRKVALLVTQPADAVTYEGAYHRVELENLLFSWAEALPPGWVGVPTYHVGQILAEPLEGALARSTARLCFLPRDLSQGLTETLLAEADGMITISSTSAMAALLFRKRVIVTGVSPFNAWCDRDPAAIGRAQTLSPAEATSLFCYLTNRNSYNHETLMHHPEKLAEVMRAVLHEPDAARWFLDPESWDRDKAMSLFQFRTCGLLEDSRNDCVRDELSRQLAAARAERDAIRGEWTSAVRQRDDLDARLATAVSERSSFEMEWGAAVADRDRQLGALSATRVERDDWQNRATLVVADRDRLVGELAMASLRGDVLARQCTEAVVECDTLRAGLSTVEADLATMQESVGRVAESRQALDRELGEARAEIARLDAGHAVTQQAWADERLAVAQQTDALRQELQALTAAHAAALSAIADHDGRWAQWQGLHARLRVALERTLPENPASVRVWDADAMAAGLHAMIEHTDALLSALRGDLERKTRENALQAVQSESYRQAMQISVQQLEAAAERRAADRRELDDVRAEWTSTIAAAGALARQLHESATERDFSRRRHVQREERMAEELGNRVALADDLERKLRTLGEQLRRCETDAASYKRDVAASTSWRVTAPLRWIKSGWITTR